MNKIRSLFVKKCRHNWQEIDDWVSDVPSKEEIKNTKFNYINYHYLYRCNK